MSTAKGKDPILDNLIWSDIEYTLHEFVDRFPLPQIVKVTEGYYGPTEDSCIGAEQILTLHCVKSTEKVLARDRKKRELNIPLNCSQKVEVRPADFRGIYETVEEISRIPTKFVRVTQGYYGLDEDSVCVNPGDKLEVIRVEHGLTGKEHCVLFHNEERNPVRLPFSVSAGFQSLLDGREYYLKELITSSPKLPLYFQFVDPPCITRRSSEQVFNTSLGVLSLEKVYQDATVICTTKEGNVRTVVSCPKHLPVTINVARGALSDDKDYVRICRVFHDGVSLAKIENLEIQNIYASRDTIREYEYIADVLPPPPVPPRDSSSEDTATPNHQVTPTGTSESPDSDDDAHEYNYIDDYDFPSPPNINEELQNSDASPLPASDAFQGMTDLDKKFSETILNDDDAGIVNDDDGYLYQPVEANSLPSQPKSSDTTVDKQEPVAPPRKAKSETKKNVDGNKPETKPKPPPPAVKPKPVINRSHSLPHQKVKDFKVPDDLSQMTVNEVSQFLRHFHFGDYVEVFAENDVDGSMLVSLEDDELKALGMNAFQCKKVKKLVGGWRPKE